MSQFMAVVRAASRRVRVDEDGQGLTEYALILTLIALVALVALALLGNNVTSVLSTMANSL